MVVEFNGNAFVGTGEDGAKTELLVLNLIETGKIAPSELKRLRKRIEQSHIHQSQTQEEEK